MDQWAANLRIWDRRHVELVVETQSEKVVSSFNMSGSRISRQLRMARNGGSGSHKTSSDSLWRSSFVPLDQSGLVNKLSPAAWTNLEMAELVFTNTGRRRSRCDRCGPGWSCTWGSRTWWMPSMILHRHRGTSPHRRADHQPSGRDVPHSGQFRKLGVQRSWLLLTAAGTGAAPADASVAVGSVAVGAVAALVSPAPPAGAVSVDLTSFPDIVQPAAMQAREIAENWYTRQMDKVSHVRDCLGDWTVER